MFAFEFTRMVRPATRTLNLEPGTRTSNKNPELGTRNRELLEWQMIL